jgi:hypothetical protein
MRVLSNVSVCPYKEEEFFRVYKGATSDLHREYLTKYLADLGAKTIVTEQDYIDGDYLEDYISYYARCFKPYGKNTKRIHFFSREFKEEYFRKILENKLPAKEIQDTLRTYLGFIVVKPLPNKIFGRTCLKSHPEESRENYPALRIYSVNLYGLALKVESLAWQEQDSVVAACATSALWVCFHGTGSIFQHKTPSPAEITRRAGEHLPDNLLTTNAASARTFPNASGLTLPQMVHAMRCISLEPLAVSAVSREALNSVAYAYLKCRIPSVLGIKLVGKHHPNKHAVAVTGYSLEDIQPEEDAPLENGPLLRTRRITELYAHDDQVGPFARMKWSVKNGVDIFETPLEKELEKKFGEKFTVIPESLLLPLYYKIRIPFSMLENCVAELDTGLEKIRRQRFKEVRRAEWDIFLTTVNDYKSSVRNDKEYGVEAVAPALLKSLPRFLWRAMLRVDERLEFDFLFDATGIDGDNLLVYAAQTQEDCLYAPIFVALVTSKPDALPKHKQALAILENFSTKQRHRRPKQ